ncbi:MAG: amidase [Actinobacteria bacterium]|nr:amidase [Actinomycetota bacterium]
MTNRVDAYFDDALGADDAVGTASRIASGEISAIEAVEAAIARVEQVDPTLEAVAHRGFDDALVAARRSRPSDGPFAGVPSFLKDNVEFAGLPSCHGSKAIDPVPVKATNAPAAQFVAQGYVILGKSSMPEFGLTPSTEFADGSATRNPWNPEYSAGASSGGAAALVASGAVPIAHGNDGGGSIRIPAAACGLVGLKTTRGRTRDRQGARLLPVNLSAEGALCRTVRDAAHHLAAMERTYANPHLPLVGTIRGPSARRLRIGVARIAPSGVPVDPATMAQTDATVELLTELGHHVDEVALPTGGHLVDDFVLYWAFMAVLMSVSEKTERGRHFHPERLDPVTKGLKARWHRHRLETVGAIRRLRAARVDYDAMFEAHDLVVSPTLNQPTPRLGYLAPTLDFEELLHRMATYVGFTPVNNICGGPSIALPTPLGTDGLPGSVHFSAAWGDEATLLGLAYELEAARPFPMIHDRF